MRVQEAGHLLPRRRAGHRVRPAERLAPQPRHAKLDVLVPRLIVDREREVGAVPLGRARLVRPALVVAVARTGNVLVDLVQERIEAALAAHIVVQGLRARDEIQIQLERVAVRLLKQVDDVGQFFRGLVAHAVCQPEPPGRGVAADHRAQERVEEAEGMAVPGAQGVRRGVAAGFFHGRVWRDRALLAAKVGAHAVHVAGHDRHAQRGLAAEPAAAALRLRNLVRAQQARQDGDLLDGGVVAVVVHNRRHVRAVPGAVLPRVGHHFAQRVLPRAGPVRHAGGALPMSRSSSVGWVVRVGGEQEIQAPSAAGKRHARAEGVIGLEAVHKVGAEQGHLVVDHVRIRPAAPQHLKQVKHAAGFLEVVNRHHGLPMRHTLVRVVHGIVAVGLRHFQHDTGPARQGEGVAGVDQSKIARARSGGGGVALAAHKLGVERVDVAAGRQFLQLDLAAGRPDGHVALDACQALGWSLQGRGNGEPAALEHVAHARGRRR